MTIYPSRFGLSIIVIFLSSTSILSSFSLPALAQTSNGFSSVAYSMNNKNPVVFQISGQGGGNAFCPSSNNPQSPMPQHELDGAQIRFDVGQPVSSTAFGKPFGELSLFRPDSSVSTYGQVNNIAIKEDNSLEIEGLLYHDFLCSPASDNAASFPVQPATTFKINGQCGTAIPIEFTASNGERALFSGNIQCHR